MLRFGGGWRRVVSFEKSAIYEDVRCVLAVCGTKRLHEGHLNLGEQIRTKVTERDPNTNIRMAMRRGDRSRAELVLKIETADIRRLVNVSVNTCQRPHVCTRGNDRSTHTSTSAILSKWTESTLLVPEKANARPRMLSRASARGFWSKLTPGLRVLSIGTVKDTPSRRRRESGTDREPRKRRRWLGGVYT